MTLSPEASHRAIERRSARRGMGFHLLRSSFAVGSWLLPGPTVRYAHRLFETPLASARNLAKGHAPLPFELSYLPWRGERLAVYQWGDPTCQPTVLLVHGWSCHTQSFAPWLPTLRAAGYAVVAFDQLGHGRSSGHRNDLPGFVAALLKVARHCETGIERLQGDTSPRLAAVIGHSLGAASASLAMSKGLQAGRVVLVAPPADLRAVSQRFARIIGLAGHLVPPLLQRFREQSGLDPRLLQPHRYTPALSTPALVIHDCADGEVPWADGEQYARSWPGARMFSTDGLGHYRILGDPQVVGAAIRFLAGEAIGERVVATSNLPLGIA